MCGNSFFGKIGLENVTTTVSTTAITSVTTVTTVTTITTAAGTNVTRQFASYGHALTG